MRRLCLLALFLVCCGSAIAQNPVAATVVNAASNIPPGLPNAPIAQGALMVI